MTFTFALFCLIEFSNITQKCEGSATIYGCTQATCHSLYMSNGDLRCESFL